VAKIPEDSSALAVAAGRAPAGIKRAVLPETIRQPLRNLVAEAARQAANSTDADS
jgi:hypothetical protein